MLQVQEVGTGNREEGQVRLQDRSSGVKDTNGVNSREQEDHVKKDYSGLI